MDGIGTKLTIQETSRSYRVSGEIDAHTAPALDEVIEQSLAAGSTMIRLCLNDVSFIDSSGLRVIIARTADARDAGGDLVLEQPGNAVSRVIEITGLTDQLTVESTAR